MTLESSLPYLSVAASFAGGWTTGGRSPRLAAGFRTLALAAVGLFAYFRWIAPSEVALALALSAAGQSLQRPGRSRWRSAAAAFTFAGWLVLAYLFLKTGDGRVSVVADGAKAGLLAGVLLAIGLGARRLWPVWRTPRWPLAVAAAGLLAMWVGAVTLDWGFWPVLVGAGAVLLGAFLDMALEAGLLPDVRLTARLAWASSYIGQAAIAYAFLR